LLRLQQTRFAFTPKVFPENFSPTYTNEAHLWLTLVARGLEGERAPLGHGHNPLFYRDNTLMLPGDAKKMTEETGKAMG